ncbi:MAG TPA: RNA polymerase factor sigma-54 [Thermoguttaceae bacterium]|nr:RNA polymerase factor sigma-54 [Thermoguttaceae bacterium]
MRLSLGQEMRQVQKQILAPRMIQSMEILQLPILALQERIEQEMQENPVLEQVEIDPDAAPEESEEPLEPTPSEPVAESEREFVIDEAKPEADFERLVEMDEQWPEHFEEHTRPSRNRMEEEAERQHDAMANLTARPPTLQDYLESQLAWFDLAPDLRAMCERIIYNLDHNGYLTTKELRDLLGPESTEADLALAERALAMVQKLDPPGVGARDLRECLLLQLTPGMPYYDELRTLITHHLEDIEQNRLPAIAKKTGYSLETIQAVLQELRKLNPKPGADFQEEFIPPVTPDVYVERTDDGGYKARLEEGRLPQLVISPYYRRLLSDPQTNEQTREYIKRKLNSAQWLIDAISQRRNTLLRVAQAIVDHQKNFLDKGPEYIEPLKMQQIAEKVGVHVTTVSRAVDDKWIQTPRGIFPLKRFFCGGTISAEGDEVAWDAVRLKLQEIIANEDKQNPLSDEDLMHELAKHGIQVARRTVTKYRKALRIPSSRQRREWSAVMGKSASKLATPPAGSSSVAEGDAGLTSSS